MTERRILKLGDFAFKVYETEGFLLSSFENVFCDQSYQILKEAFACVDWKRKQDLFYTHYESYITPKDSHGLSSLFHPIFFRDLKGKLENIFGVKFQNRLKIAAHKLLSSDAIGMHNDYSHPSLGYENFRLILQFSDFGTQLTGGELSFFASKYTKEIIQTFNNRQNAGVCFQITPNSYHAVSKVEGERFTLVLYLWQEGREIHESSFEIPSI